MKTNLFNILTAGLLCCGISANAQLAEVSAPKQICVDGANGIFNPILSADGDQLLFSCEDYSNLRLHNFLTNTTVTVDEAARCGFDAQFTADGKNVVYVAQRVNSDGLNMRQARSYDIYFDKVTELAPEARVVERPVLAKDGGFAVRLNGKAMSRKAPQNSVRTWESTLYITLNGVEKAYQPVESEAGYLWESLSPDGTKVMFFAAGKGIIITDLQGNIIARPGNYEKPVWFGNNHIVAMNATDDGHQLHSSCIMLLSADGSAKQNLTMPESMTMNPTASFESGKVVYNTVDGKLYELNVTLK